MSLSGGKSTAIVRHDRFDIEADEAALIDKARRRLAVVALLLTSFMPGDILEGSDEERAAIALQIALELVS